jgi:pyrimidine-nucleoside phosphorylase
MNTAKLIRDKRDGLELTEQQIDELIQGFTSGDVPDYQMSAFAMAVFFKGMTSEETTALTKAMINSGEKLKWSGAKPSVDKHSTGGIGDKTSIALAPLLACCDVEVPMISGRGLGTTGGTLDKLESIGGYRTEISTDEFRSIVNFSACSIASATASIAPADRKLYALRDVTGTVESIPLITASILSKKIAEGIDCLVLDVKWGSGAFMKTLDRARELAKSLVSVGSQLGVKIEAVITDMNQPLGRMIGNAVEIDECVDLLKGAAPDDVTELTLHLAGRLLVISGRCESMGQAVELLKSRIETGEALAKLREMVKGHGGDLDVPRKRERDSDVTATQSGFVTRISTDRLGLAMIEMGGGRKKMEDPINPSCGIEFLVSIGDEIKEGDTIARLFCEGSAKNYAAELIRAAVTIGDQTVARPPLIVETL